MNPKSKYWRLWVPKQGDFHVTGTDQHNVFDAIEAVEALAKGGRVSWGLGIKRDTPYGNERPVVLS